MMQLNRTSPGVNGQTKIESITQAMELLREPKLEEHHSKNLEQNFTYYRCEAKGIKAFNGTPVFTSSKTHSICRRIVNTEFDNYKRKCGIGSFPLDRAPWIASVMIRNKSSTVAPLFRATGSIIHPNLILVPHEPFELFNRDKLMIRSNGQTQTLSVDNTNAQTREVVTRIAQNFTSLKYQRFKITMLVLAEPLFFNEHTQSICLPLTDDQYEQENCVVLGWNRTTKKLMKHRTDLIECTDVGQGIGLTVPKEFFICTNSSAIEPFRQAANSCGKNHICDFSTVLVCPAAEQSNTSTNKVYYQVGVGFMLANERGYFLSTTAAKYWIDQTVHNLQLNSQYFTRYNE